jgi:hypothetical protein
MSVLDGYTRWVYYFRWKHYEYSSGSVTSLMSLQPCDSVSSPVEGTLVASCK